jgi:hypothetical protein
MGGNNGCMHNDHAISCSVGHYVLLSPTKQCSFNKTSDNIMVQKLYLFATKEEHYCKISQIELQAIWALSMSFYM